MTLEHDNITTLNVVKTIIALILRAVRPHRACHIALVDTCLIETPVYETGTIEHIGTFATTDISAADLIIGNPDEPLYS